MADIFKTEPEMMPAQMPVKVAQSVEEMRELRIPASAIFDQSRSIEHVERPRRGHKM